MDQKNQLRALDRAIEALGGVTAAARQLPVRSYQTVQQWRTSGVPIEHCTAIERATEGAITRRDLRPDDWWLIWPELVDVDHPQGKPIPLAEREGDEGAAEENSGEKEAA